MKIFTKIKEWWDEPDALGLAGQLIFRGIREEAKEAEEKRKDRIALHQMACDLRDIKNSMEETKCH